MNAPLDLTGVKFGLLTATVHGNRTNRNVIRWLCVCECGQTVERTASTLRLVEKKRYVASCGCAQYTNTTKHGKRNHPIYAVYHAAKQRCCNPKDRRYADYGGRGVAMCERWLVSFENFWADMGPTWQQGLSLDRRDNEQGYSPENCRWATQTEQANNQRHHADWLPHNLVAMACDTGTPYGTLLSRYHKGKIGFAFLASYEIARAQ